MKSPLSHRPFSFESLGYPQLSEFELNTLRIESAVLKKNPWGDTPLRHCPLLRPRRAPLAKKSWGLVFVLSGFAGNGTKSLGDRGFEETQLQQINRLVKEGLAPEAFYCFVDAWTFWGGSQFLNSKGMGNYEDFIVQELHPLLLNELPIDPKKVALVGHSSGGYGALHLASMHPQLFPFCGAMAPDCYFEASLLPDFYKAAPFLGKYSHLKKGNEFQQPQKILKFKQGFQILNCIAMTLCYSSGLHQRALEWPIDLKTGEVRSKIWATWKEKDPLVFLKKRKTQLKRLNGFYLDVGSTDEFQLQFGVRQIHQWLRSQKIRHHFDEFEGGHFDSQERFPVLWQWLMKTW